MKRFEVGNSSGADAPAFPLGKTGGLIEASLNVLCATFCDLLVSAG